MSQSLQDRYAPNNRCFGCGPANERGLRIKSRVEGDALVCDFRPEQHHLAFGRVVNGGIIATLLDCHANWAAAHRLMTEQGLDHPPCTVTAELSVKLRAPTPLDAVLRVWAQPSAVDGDRVTVEARVQAAGKTTASGRGVFVAVREGHPAFHRW